MSLEELDQRFKLTDMYLELYKRPWSVKLLTFIVYEEKKRAMRGIPTATEDKRAYLD